MGVFEGFLLTIQLTVLSILFQIHGLGKSKYFFTVFLSSFVILAILGLIKKSGV